MNLRFALFTFALIAAFSFASFSQTAPAANAKVALIDTGAFADPKAGITKFLNAYKALDSEFKPARDELVGLNTRIDTLKKEIDQLQTRANTSPPDVNAIVVSINQKTDEVTRLQTDFKRKQEDGQSRIARREREVTDPIWKEVGDAILVYGKTKNIDILIDLSKLAGAVLMLNETVDITDAFIKEFNAKTSGVPVR